MRIFLVLVLGGCTLGTVAESPDANGLAVSPDDAGSTPAQPPDDLMTTRDLESSSFDLFTPPDLWKERPKARPSPIAAENLKAGDSGWRLTAPSNGVAGFADRQSYLPGDTAQICAGDAAATIITWELWRLGYYGGAGGRKITGGGPLALPAAPAATLDSSTGMVRAPWPVAFTVPLAADLPTGFYVVKLIGPSTQSYVPLVVKEPKPAAPTVWPVAFNTYQAYNAWGGTSLYNNNRSDWQPWHAYAVSFDRPYLQGDGAGQLFFADRDFITFAEGQGYDLDYVADSDVDADTSQLSGRALIVLQGHSEYWSADQRAHLVAAVAGGSNLAVFGANDLYWQVRYDAPRRTLTGYKEFANLDPIGDPSLETTEWRLLGKPENALLGVEFGEWIWSSVPLRVSDPSSWIWSGAGVDAGALIAGLYGFEIDRRYANGYEPAGVSEIGAGLGENHSAELATGQATIYTAPSGATVFASGTVSWSQALAAQGIWDARVQQATHNLFARLAGAVGATPKTLILPAGPAVPDRVPGVQVSTVTSALTAPVAIAAAPDGTLIVADQDRVVRVDSSGTISLLADGLAGPRGLAVAPNGDVYIADTGNHQIKKLRSGVLTTVAGSTEGYAEGKPGQLDQPMSLALLPSGVLLVVDTWNQRVRAMAPDGTLSTWVGSGAEAVADGQGAAASFWFPFAIAAFPDGTAAVAESNDGLVRRIAPDRTVSTFAGELGRTGWWDGSADTAAISELQGLAARSDGALVLLDAASYRVRILSNGVVRTLAGGATSALVDGAGEVAGFSLPRAAAFAADGSLWICDTGNHALRRITGSTF